MLIVCVDVVARAMPKSVTFTFPSFEMIIFLSLIHISLLDDLGFEKAFIPLRTKLSMEENGYTFNENGDVYKRQIFS